MIQSLRMAEKWRECIFKRLLFSGKRIFSLFTLSPPSTSVSWKTNSDLIRRLFHLSVCAKCVFDARSLFILFSVLQPPFAAHRQNETQRMNSIWMKKRRAIFAEPASPQWNSTCQTSQRQFRSILSTFHFHRTLALILVFSHINLNTRILNFHFERTIRAYKPKKGRVCARV